VKNLILAGGRASRELSVLIPKGRNKVLLKIMGKPVIYYSLNGLQQTVSAETILVYRAGEEDVYREASSYSQTPLIPVVQETGDSVHEAILAAESRLRDIDYFFLVFGDIIVEQDAFTHLLNTHLTEEPSATILVVPIEPRNVYTYGLAIVDENSFVKKVVEKPQSIELREPCYALGGLYILPIWILDKLEKGYTLPQAIDYLARESRVRAVYYSDLWIDIGYPTDLLEATYQLLSRIDQQFISNKAEIETNTVIKGPVYISDNVYIDHYVVIKGPVYLGDDSFIGAHSFIRHYVNIENRVRIGAFNEIRYSNIQPYTFTHSRVTIMDSIIGENTLFESNITLLNVLSEEEEPPRLRIHIVNKPGEKIRKMGSVIGYNSRISTNKVLKPGTILEPNTVLK